MNRFFSSDFIRSTHSPFSIMTGCTLIILASSRLSFALFSVGALLWVYIMTKAVYLLVKNILPAKGKTVLLIFLSGFIASLYLFFMSFINPILVLNCWVFIILIPPCLTTSGLLFKLDNTEPVEAVIRIVLEAASLGAIIIFISLIREPLGFGALSFPGGRGGIIEVFNSSGEGFFTVKILSASSGGLLLLGYSAAMYKYIRAVKNNREEDE